MVFAVAVSMTFGSGLMAQEANAKKFTQADYDAAYKLFTSMDMNNQMKDSIDAMMDLQTRQVPQLASCRKEVEAFFGKYISYDALKKDLAEIYLNAFTVDELGKLTDFYESPLGKKFSKQNSTIMRQAMELSNSKLRSHMSELQQIIMKSMNAGKAQQNNLVTPN